MSNLSDLPFGATEFSAPLLAWYGRQGRDLPWRNTRDPYRIWLSEIMLQQTTVAAVIDYFQRFLQAFPTLDALAGAKQEDVIALWAGLGYYSRARNLHKTAQIVRAEYEGRFPVEVESLCKLPGIGRSTAGAISALAFDQQAAILDGNVRRVLCRLCAWQEPARTTAAEKQLWYWAELLTPHQRVHDYTQAIMDLGATVCMPRQPQCGICPVAAVCQGYELGIAAELPVKMPKKTVPTRRQVAVVIASKGRCLVRRRASEGFLGGLWEFPQVSVGDDETPEQQLSLLMQDHGLTGAADLLGQIKHIYSHFRLELSLYKIQGDNLRIAEHDGEWLAFEALAELPFHGAHKKALKLIDSCF